MMVLDSSVEFPGLKSAKSFLQMLTKKKLQSTVSETLKLTQIHPRDISIE